MIKYNELISQSGLTIWDAIDSNKHKLWIPTEELEKLRGRIDNVIRTKDEDLGRDILEEIAAMFVGVTLIYQLVGRIRSWDERFNQINWKNPQRVRQLLNQGLQIIAQNPSEEKLLPLVIECENNLPDRPCPNCGGIIGKTCSCVTE